MPLDHEVEYVPKLPLPARTGPQAKVKPHVDEAGYAKMYRRSLDEPEQFWDEVSFLLKCSAVSQSMMLNMRPSHLSRWQRKPSVGSPPTKQSATELLRMATCLGSLKEASDPLSPQRTLLPSHSTDFVSQNRAQRQLQLC